MVRRKPKILDIIFPGIIASCACITAGLLIASHSSLGFGASLAWLSVVVVLSVTSIIRR